MNRWCFPDNSDKAEALWQSDKKLVVVGVIGKSANYDANKLAAFKILGRHPGLFHHTPREGQIQFLYNANESMLLVHFESTYDSACMQQMLDAELTNGTFGEFLLFNQRVRNRFARMLLFATQICHIIVFVELSVTFDASLLPIFKALRIIRDKHILRFLPKLIKNSSTGAALGKFARLCSPRVLFLFENFPNGYEKSQEAISKLEFEVEDNIYRMLRNEFIVANNSGMSLFSIPSNKRFVYYNTDVTVREDPVVKSACMLHALLEKLHTKKTLDKEEEDSLCPYRGFGKPLIQCSREVKVFTEESRLLQERQFMTLLKDHIDEGLTTGFDDSLTNKHKGKHNHFVVLTPKAWYETFKMLHQIFIVNPDNPDFEANDIDYKLYLDSFDRIMNFDDEFFNACCDIGLQKAFTIYNNPALTHYSATVHKKLVEEAVTLYLKYARGPRATVNETKLRDMCDTCWLSKQQCEQPSLRGHPCILPKHLVQDAAEHSSGHVFVSSCNCGRSQGRREDPYTIRHANYEFYEYMASNCNLCAKVKKVTFAVFEPSSKDFRAAEFEIAFPKLVLSETPPVPHAVAAAQSTDEDDEDNNASQPLTASQGSHTNLSLESTDHLHRKALQMDGDGISSDDDDEDDDVDANSLNELVLQVQAEHERNIYRQPSTTEYLPGMAHMESPMGLLPQFPSWSLVCVGPSAVYSHNTGLPEHFQTGFLSGTNFLLPWDVHVRLEHSASWAAAYEKTRYRKMGEVFVLKIFVGCEYECPRGHRFMMSSPEKVLRGGSGILRDSGSKIVYNNMPLYFPCPCRSRSGGVAQLMRVHVVTPKAPVNVIVEPKVRTGERNYVFTLGLPSPPKLTQSAYWILRLPYIYQGDEEPIGPPSEVTAANAINYGCLLAGMFGVSETEVDEQ